MISTPTSDHVWEDVQGDLDGALLVVLFGTVEVLLVLVLNPSGSKRILLDLLSFLTGETQPALDGRLMSELDISIVCFAI